MQYLIEQGADANVRKDDGSTPLHLAVARYWGHGEQTVVEEMLRRGADPAIRDADGKSPLDIALARDPGAAGKFEEARRKR